MFFSISRYAPIGLRVMGGLMVMGNLATAMGVAQAQVIPDGTLPTAVMSPNQLNFTIDGGGRSGPNLFHSFSEFSVPTGGSAVFNTAADVQNIFSRVTGSRVSNIDGLIQTGGQANLFLLNPNGILFGPNAVLNIGGSFLGTTASSVQFADGVAFSASNPAPLLTMSVPIGLQMGQTPGPITVQTPYVVSQAGEPQFGMVVAPGQTLGLLGGDLLLENAGILLTGGRIELGSVGANSAVAIVPTPLAWTLNYGAVQTFQDIRLDQGSVVVVLNGEGIQVQGKTIQLDNGSQLGMGRTDAGNGGELSLHASELLKVTGPVLEGQPTVIFSQVIGRNGTGTGADIKIAAQEIQMQNGGLLSATTFSRGNAGNLSIETARLRLINGGQVGAGTFAAGNGGKLSIRASELVEIAGFLRDDETASGLFTSSESRATGNGGRLDLQTTDLQIRDGGKIAANTLYKGNAGEIMIQANTVTISGNWLDFSGTGGGLVVSVGKKSTGQGGNITLKANQLKLLDGGQIVADTVGAGNAGNINIQAQTIDVRGTTADQSFTSQISATSATPAAAGSIRINTDSLNLQDQGKIAVSGLNTGNAGNLSITANLVRLNQGGMLQAEVQNGSLGNIAINSNTLLLRGGSAITTTAGKDANGGNITINSPIVVGLENSDITANAVKGQGGNIQITTQGILGLKFRPQLTPENDITASSEFGVNGSVDVTTIGVDPNAGLMALPANIVDPSQKIATGCGGNQGGSFVVTGRGGIPENPSQHTIGDQSWSDLRPIGDAIPASADVKPAVHPPLIEATTWHRNSSGQPELIAGLPMASNSVTCAK